MTAVLGSDQRSDPRRSISTPILCALAMPCSSFLYFQCIVSTLSPDGRPEPKEDEWDRQHGQADEAQQARCPVDAQALVHLEGEEREYCQWSAEPCMRSAT